MAKIQKIKGFVDLFPEEAAKFTRMETLARDVFTRYAFGELRTPVLEKTELFQKIHRRGHRRGGQGDVHLPGPQGPLPDHAPRSHGGRGPRLHRVRHAPAGQDIQVLHLWPHVPLRAAPERPPAPVPPDQRGDIRRARGPGRRRADPHAAHLFERAGPDQADRGAQLPGLPCVPPGLPAGPHRLLHGQGPGQFLRGLPPAAWTPTPCACSTARCRAARPWSRTPRPSPTTSAPSAKPISRTCAPFSTARA